jgi:hypothetical protein
MGGDLLRDSGGRAATRTVSRSASTWRQNGDQAAVPQAVCGVGLRAVSVAFWRLEQIMYSVEKLP